MELIVRDRKPRLVIQGSEYGYEVESSPGQEKITLSKYGDLNDPQHVVTRIVCRNGERKDDRWRCTCRGFFFRKKCRHIEPCKELSEYLDATTPVPNRPAKEDTVHV